MPRSYERSQSQIRPLSIQRKYTRQAPGSVLIEMGNTRVLCTSSVEAKVPEFLVGKNKGWLTAEYSMLPNSTSPRKQRDRSGKVDGRSVEIQRLIGRSLRNVIKLSSLGERTIWIDCDVLDADGGTRTASITGAFIAAVDAILATDLAPRVSEIVIDSVAAVSVGICKGEVLADLDYSEDSTAGVDMNLVMTGEGKFIEVQGTGETVSFSFEELQSMISVGRSAIEQLHDAQKHALGKDWPFQR